MVVYKPVVDLRPTTIMKAFILNSILLGIVTALTIEVRRKVDTFKQSEGRKVFVTATMSVMISLIAYILCRFLFGLGDGMLASPPWKTSFF